MTHFSNMELLKSGGALRLTSRYGYRPVEGMMHVFVPGC
jgi:hypothetical protein